MVLVCCLVFTVRLSSMLRPQKTLTDYIVIAISPALIMVLIGSLVFFLIESFYQGQYDGRVRWAFGWFVFAAVLIGRISIDEGREYASLYAIPLGLAMLAVLLRFVEFRGPLAGLSLPINAGLIVLVLWCADRLTWDCTVIDDRKDASGQGLLQTAGLDRARQSGADSSDRQEDQDLQATSSRDQQPPATWWERFCEYRKRPHAPGVWVIYISLAALPLFGIGQRFIPAANLESRRFAFWMLCAFVASALGLLLNSSFLALRRYLRQRRLEMPTQMAGVWLGTGVVMIMVLLMLCTALPRPHPEYSITHIDWSIGSPSGLSPSRYGTGRQGAEAPAQGAPSRNGEHPSGQTQGEESDGSRDGQGKPSEAPKSESGESKNGQSNDEASADGQSAGKSDGKSGDKQPGGGKSGQQKSGDSQSKASKPDASDRPDASESQRSTEQAAQSPRQMQRPPASPRGILNSVWNTLPHLFKWLYYLAFFALVAYLVWRYWHQIRLAVLGFVQAIQDLLARLLGGRFPATANVTPASSAPVQTPPRPFAAFPDPFASGAARQLDPRELVIYTFRALEAWGREHDCPRMDDQTPHEFAGRLALAAEDVGREATRLADLYCAVAYSNLPLVPAHVGRLENLWKILRGQVGTT
jgi:hypothetical protein